MVIVSMVAPAYTIATTTRSVLVLLGTLESPAVVRHVITVFFSLVSYGLSAMNTKTDAVLVVFSLCRLVDGSSFSIVRIHFRVFL